MALYNIKKIIKNIEELGFDEVKIFTGHSKSSSITFENEIFTNNTTHESNGITINAIVKGKAVSISFSGQSEDEVLENAKTLKTLLNYKTKEVDETYVIPPNLKYAKVPKIITNLPTQDEIRKIIKTFAKKINSLSKYINTKNTIVAYGYGQNENTMTTNHGVHFEKVSGVGFGIQAVVYLQKEDVKNQIFVSRFYKTKEDIDLNEMLSAIKKEISLVLDETIPKSGSYEIVCAPSVFYEFLSPFLDHLNARFIIDKLSVWDTKLGKQIGSKLLTVVDATIVPELGIYNTFDADGLPTYNKNLIEKGIIKTFIHNQKTAKILKSTSTGNSSGDSPDFGLTYVKNGKNTEEEIIGSVKEGIYLRELSGLHSGINDLSGEMSVEFSGNIIKNGKIGKAIKSGVISGNFFTDVITKINMVGNDLDLTKGYYSPTIKLDKLSIIVEQKNTK